MPCSNEYMIIKIKKFGTTLISRQFGKEAYLAFQPELKNVKKTEKIKVDFEGVSTLAPSWADEFLTPLNSIYKNVELVNTSNLSVLETIKILEEIAGKDFNKKS